MPDDPVLDDLLMACRRVGEAMDLFDEAACRRLGVGRSDLRALNLLEHGPLSAGDIARRLGRSKGSVTTLIDRLERAGYVRREAGADRRSVMVALEPATWRAFAAVYRPLGLRVAASTDGLAPAHRQRVAATLERMSTAFDEARAGLEVPER